MIDNRPEIMIKQLYNHKYIGIQLIIKPNQIEV